MSLLQQPTNKDQFTDFNQVNITEKLASYIEYMGDPYGRVWHELLRDSQYPLTANWMHKSILISITTSIVKRVTELPQIYLLNLLYILKLPLMYYVTIIDIFSDYLHVSINWIQNPTMELQFIVFIIISHQHRVSSCKKLITIEYLCPCIKLYSPNGKQGVGLFNRKEENFNLMQCKDSSP